MLIDFYADWCVACKLLESKTFLNEAVALRLSEFFLIRVDASRSSDYVLQLQGRYKVVGLPTMVFFDSSSRLLESIILCWFSYRRKNFGISRAN